MADPTQLTPEEEQKRLNLIQQQGVAAKDLASTYEKLEKTLGRLTAEEKESLNIAKELQRLSTNLEKSIQNRLDRSGSIKSLEKSLNQLLIDQAKTLATQASVTNKLNDDKIKALAEQTRLSNQQALQQTILNQEMRAQQIILDEIDHLKSQQGSIDRVTLHNLNQQLSISKNATKISEKTLEQTKKQHEEQKDLTKQITAAKQAHEDIIKQQKEEIALAEHELKIRNGLAMLDHLNKTFGTDKIAEMFTLVGLFKMLLDAALKFNVISVKTSKDLGYGADNADRVTSSLVDMARSSSNVNVTLKNAGEAMSQLNEATGGGAEYTADALETQIMLTKQLGLSGEEAAGIYKYSVLTGQSSEKVNDEMVAAFANTRNAVKGSANFKTTMAEAAKVSGQLAANLQNNPGLITEAVVKAQALGTTLEQVKNQGASLLNFESSISKELDAELLTGKQLNLERARAAALSGDQITLAEELNKNVGTLEDFQKMNVLQQNALADAVGLTADQLSDQLRKQKIAVEQGKSLAQVTADEAKEAENRQAIQDKFNAAIEKLQDFIGNLVSGPIAGLLEALTKILPIAMSIGTAFLVITSAARLGAMYESLKAGFAVASAAALQGQLATQGALNIAKGKDLATSIGIAAAWTIANPFKALLGLAIAAGVGTMIYSQMNDGVIGPGGETMVSGPEGSIQLNKDDSMVVGTDLFGGDKNKSGGGSMQGPSIDLTPMITAINAVKVSIDRLYGKDTSIYMDGKKVGTTLSQNSHKVA
jgi:hypothetical protein